MNPTDLPIEYELIQTAASAKIEVTNVDIAEAGGGDLAMTIEARMEEEDVPIYAFAVVYALGVHSFREARPMPGSPLGDDTFTAADMLRHLSFRLGRLN